MVTALVLKLSKNCLSLYQCIDEGHNLLSGFQRVCVAGVLASLVGGCALGESLTVYEAIEKGNGVRQTGVAELPPETGSDLLSPEQRAASEAHLLAISAESKRRAGLHADFESSTEELRIYCGRTWLLNNNVLLFIGCSRILVFNTVKPA